MPAAGSRKTQVYWYISGHGGKLLFCTELIFLSSFLIAENTRKGHLQWIAHPRRDGACMSQVTGSPWNIPNPLWAEGSWSHTTSACFSFYCGFLLGKETVPCLQKCFETLECSSAKGNRQLLAAVAATAAVLRKAGRAARLSLGWFVSS